MGDIKSCPGMIKMVKLIMGAIGEKNSIIKIKSFNRRRIRMFSMTYKLNSY